MEVDNILICRLPDAWQGYAPPDIKLQWVMGLRRFLEGRSRTILFADLHQHAKQNRQHRKRKSGWGTFKRKCGQMAHLLQAWKQCLLTPYQNGSLKIPLWMSIVEPGSSLGTLIIQAWSNANKKENTTKLQPVNKVIALSTFGKNEVPSIGHNVKIIWLKLERVISRVVLRTPFHESLFVLSKQMIIISKISY